MTYQFLMNIFAYRAHFGDAGSLASCVLMYSLSAWLCVGYCLVCDSNKWSSAWL